MRSGVMYLGFIVFTLISQMGLAQNALNIPPILTGTIFNLSIQKGNSSFYPSHTTPTYGVNGIWMAPTISVNKGDSISINVINNLTETTTMHWHGLHVSAYNDGGPNQIIAAGGLWQPKFVIRNNAGTFWYHPHGEGKTDPQVSKGLAGMIIIHDSIEATLNIPKTYGVDDIPIIVQSKAFDILQQIAISTETDTALFVNGTLYPYFDAPAQVVRFRLLNGSSMRSYNFGLSNNQQFYQIATDGGLKDTPVVLTRIRLSPGERTDILIDFQGMNGQSMQLMSYAATLPNGIYGSARVGMGIDTIAGYGDNILNGADFTIMQINVTAPSATPVTSIPAILAPFNPYSTASATLVREIVFDTLRRLPADRPNLAEGPFGINGRAFNMDSVNVVTYINNTEIWSLQNHTYVAHPFHVHNVQFNVIEKSGAPVPITERGWKDVVLVMPQDSAKFITRFETFANASEPYMYHCHLLHHEDDGMMGQFLVVDTTATGIIEPSTVSTIVVYPNPASKQISVSSTDSDKWESVELVDAIGRRIIVKGNHYFLKALTIDVSTLSPGLYHLILVNERQTISSKVVIE
jgi:blue copper oxidase